MGISYNISSLRKHVIAAFLRTCAQPTVIIPLTYVERFRFVAKEFNRIGCELFDMGVYVESAQLLVKGINRYIGEPYLVELILDDGECPEYMKLAVTKRSN